MSGLMTQIHIEIFARALKEVKIQRKKVFITENRQFLVPHVHFVEGIK